MQFLIILPQVLSILLIISVGAATSVNQRLDCFGADGYEIPYTFHNQANDLSNHNVDNSIRKVCATGVWILFEDYDFNTRDSGLASFWHYGDNSCVQLPPSFQASSLRNAGDLEDWQAAGINLYSGEYFSGEQEFLTDDKAEIKLNDQVKSLIITGCKAWTLYSDANYNNGCLCVNPQQTSAPCQPGFYSKTGSLAGMAENVSSIRLGCYCDTEAHPDNKQNKHSEL